MQEFHRICIRILQEPVQKHRKNIGTGKISRVPKRAYWAGSTNES